MPSDNSRFRLREAGPGDRHRLWVLANDPVVRSFSFSQEQIEWETHVKWFARVIEKQDSQVFVAEDAEGNFVGQVRFDLDRGDAVVTIQIVPSSRGRGFGVTLIRAGTLRYLEEIPAVNVVHAFIKKTNQVSIAAFSKAGYQHSRDLVIAGHKSCDMVFQKDSGK
ncbi:MAG: GNAT family N-acetyltransferase [Acidobacteriota bacterium]|nr:GNAT family N-acetyltransferase [Acidobacteriota bacterium]